METNTLTINYSQITKTLAQVQQKYLAKSKLMSFNLNSLTNRFPYINKKIILLNCFKLDVMNLFLNIFSENIFKLTFCCL